MQAPEQQPGEDQMLPIRGSGKDSGLSSTVHFRSGEEDPVARRAGPSARQRTKNKEAQRRFRSNQKTELKSLKDRKHDLEEQRKSLQEQVNILEIERQMLQIEISRNRDPRNSKGPEPQV